jgi:hypothetical protein
MSVSHSVIKRVFRYKMNDEIMDEVKEFGRIHKYDTKDDFNEAWKEWVNEHDDLIHQEKERLAGLGYKGDVYRKLYKSVRYYYIKKSSSSGKRDAIDVGETGETEGDGDGNGDGNGNGYGNGDGDGNGDGNGNGYGNGNGNGDGNGNGYVAAQTTNKKRILLNRSFMKAVESHIERSLERSDNLKPSECYTDFMVTNKDIVADEINYCKGKYNLEDKDDDEIIYKIKKLYKNRYFIYTCRH